MMIHLRALARCKFLSLAAAIVAMLLTPFLGISQHKKISKRIEEAAFIKLGGLEQWVTIRGDNSASPVLLLLHGGPGDVQSIFVDAYKGYETNFILVQWDQRGSGKTYGKYKEQTPELTLDRLTNDGVELAAYLKNRFKRNGIIILGHSWGTAIATEMIKKRPDLFLAYIGTGQIASWAESVQWQFDYLKRKANEANDQVMLGDLTKIGTPDPNNTAQYFSFTRPLRKYLNSADSTWLAGLREFVQGLPKNELGDLGGGMDFSGRALLPFQVKENLSTISLNFKVPYYVIQGREDLFTPADPAIAYFKRVTAPEKKIVILEHSGHFALVTHAQEFIEALNSILSTAKK